MSSNATTSLTEKLTQVALDAAKEAIAAAIAREVADEARRALGGAQGASLDDLVTIAQEAAAGLFRRQGAPAPAPEPFIPMMPVPMGPAPAPAPFIPVMPVPMTIQGEVPAPAPAPASSFTPAPAPEPFTGWLPTPVSVRQLETSAAAMATGPEIPIPVPAPPAPAPMPAPVTAAPGAQVRATTLAKLVSATPPIQAPRQGRAQPHTLAPRRGILASERRAELAAYKPFAAVKTLAHSQYVHPDGRPLLSYQETLGNRDFVLRTILAHEIAEGDLVDDLGLSQLGLDR